jgi:hypothetical protein
MQERHERNRIYTPSDSLDLLGHHDRVVLADLLALDALVVELAVVRSVVAVLAAVQSAAAAGEA